MTAHDPSEKNVDGPAPMFTDASCVHASLATLLLELDPRADVAAALGSACTTQAVRGEILPAFTHALPSPLAALRGGGYTVERQLLDEDGRPAMLDSLVSAGVVVVDVDTFHLPHHWVDHGRLHSLHTVVLRDFDPRGGTVRLTDPVDVTWYDGRVTWSSLQAPFASTPLGQSWLRVTPAPPGAGHAVAATDLSARAAALYVDGAEQLSGSALARELLAALDLFFPTAAGAEPLPPAWVNHVQHGLWTYHHALRWFAKYLATRPGEDGPRTGEAASRVERASQDWLVVRALLRHSGAAPGEPSSLRHRSEVSRRLERVADDLSRAGEALAGRESRART
ncbi:hypothetical protein ACWGBY_18100 [Streptomyces griseus]|uniref:Butirosin biosynthesis protein H N-terminal domain-containing protein n=1 Tax=Streptomyces sp. CMC78 TaxID=3231512 RepID=A0AB33KAP1_9ACTN|nr:hypothetical protein [Streptomyces sp. ID01-9D]MDX5572201.1 hypothetical protein [Streptomyces sp. ID01-9D]WSV24797.1 hypothetical protein OG554_32440 [Streptomyces fimicarius]WTC86273.1 hypothetical protein OH733_05740 [Streptomyces griseus]WTD71109.1 hypothetical protein OH763_31245 [Streptomyces griseus]